MKKFSLHILVLTLMYLAVIPYDNYVHAIFFIRIFTLWFGFNGGTHAKGLITLNIQIAKNKNKSSIYRPG